MIRVFLAVFVVLLLGACGGDEPVAVSAAQPADDATADSATPNETADDVDDEEATATATLVRGVDRDVFCPALDRITTTYLDADALAFTPGQQEAQEALFVDVEAIWTELGADYPELADALGLLQIEGLIFGTAGDAQVEPAELDAAGSLAIETWNDTCATYTPGDEEPAAPSTSSNDGPDPDSFGADGQEDEFDEECPSPETLEAEGLECDQYGNVYPSDDYSSGDGFDEECPSPETLEAEGLECDEYGNVYPSDDYSSGDGHGDGEECVDNCTDGPNPDEFGADGCEGEDC